MSDVNEAVVFGGTTANLTGSGVTGQATSAPTPIQTPAQQALAALVAANPTYDNSDYWMQGMMFNCFGFPCPMNPSRYPTNVLAGMIGAIFASMSPKIVPGPPEGAPGPMVNGQISSSYHGGVTFLASVPWLVLPDGTQIPIADIAGNAAHGYPAATLLEYMTDEITGDQAAHNAN